MRSPRVTQQEWHKGEWWPFGDSKPEANTATGTGDAVCLMVTTQPWSCEGEQPGVRTDKTRLRYRVHLH